MTLKEFFRKNKHIKNNTIIAIRKLSSKKFLFKNRITDIGYKQEFLTSEYTNSVVLNYAVLKNDGCLFDDKTQKNYILVILE